MARRALYNEMNRCKGNLEREAAQAIASKPSKPDSFGALIPWGIREGGNTLQTSQLSSGGCDGLRGRWRWPLHAGFQSGGKMRQNPSAPRAGDELFIPSQPAFTCRGLPLILSKQRGGGRDAGPLTLPSVPERGSASAALTSRSSVNTASIQERSGRVSCMSTQSKHRLCRFFRPFISHVIFSI